MLYTHLRKISCEQFIDVLSRSTLGDRRPVNDSERIVSMLEHADLLCTAWAGDLLVGVARSVTDFSYCCYVSDLAVDVSYQKRGVGLELMHLTQSRLHPKCTIILLAAPSAEGYYPKIGMTQHRSALDHTRFAVTANKKLTHAPSSWPQYDISTRRGSMYDISSRSVVGNREKPLNRN